MSDAQVAAQPRSQYVEFWNNILVPKFVRWRHILVGGLTLHSQTIFPSLQVNKGDRVIDAGCGFGDTAIELARLVGPTGSVLALDCCEGFLEYGRRDADAAGISNVTFLEADVQSFPLQPAHDFCFSRFGTQFFENPVAGLRNMRTSLKPGGIMTMVVWRGIKDNPWLGHAKDIVLQYLPPPGENAQSCGPGPFSMADTGVVTKQLEIAGYKDIEFEQIDAAGVCGQRSGRCGSLSACHRSGGRGVPRGGQASRRAPRGDCKCSQDRACKVSAAEWRHHGFQFLEGDRQKSGIDVLRSRRCTSLGC
jgi:ubiquinone/menaquinone biosynthesis C-methylase UbiE